MNYTITCPRCRANATDAPIDTALDELQRPDGRTNRFHCEGCPMVSKEHLEAQYQLRRLAIGSSCWVLSTLPVKCVGIDAYVVDGDALVSQQLRQDEQQVASAYCIRCADLGRCSVAQLSRGYTCKACLAKEPEVVEPATLTLDRVIVCALAELSTKVAREARHEQHVAAVEAEREAQHQQLLEVDAAWPGLDDAPDNALRYQAGAIPASHWTRRALAWLRIHDAAALASSPITLVSMLAACRALGLLPDPATKPRLVHGYDVAYLTTRATESNAIHRDAVLCHECAALLPEDGTAQHPYWEGPDLECTGCDATIESSYGDPAEEQAPAESVKLPGAPVDERCTEGKCSFCGHYHAPTGQRT